MALRQGPIVVVGSLNADLVVRVPRFPVAGETLTGSGFSRFPGGKGANQAYAAARLSGSVAMVGQVGDDDLGRWLVAHLARGGVDVDAVSTDPVAGTGLALITIDSRGENQIVLVPGANGTFQPERLARAAALVDTAAVVLLQLEIPVDTVVAAARLARQAGAFVILDPAPARELPPTLLALTDLVTPNEAELAALTGGGSIQGEGDVGARAGHLRDRGARAVLVKWGDRGARLVDAQGVRAWSARQVAAIDTTAAGDAFNGALAVALVEGRSLDEACAFAVAAATMSVTRAGAQPSMPARDEVEASLSSTRLP